MFKKIAISALAVSLLSTFVAPAFAADKTPFYAGLDVGTTKIDGYSENKTSVGGFVGYQFNDNFAVEGAYRNLGSTTYLKASVDVKQTAISLVASMPVAKDFSVFGRIGYNKLTASASYLGNKASDSNSGAVYGLGVSYDFTPTISSRLEFQRPDSDVKNTNVAVVFKF